MTDNGSEVSCPSDAITTVLAAVAQDTHSVINNIKRLSTAESCLIKGIMLDRSQIGMETGKHGAKRTEGDEIEGRSRRLKHEKVRQKQQDKGGKTGTRGQFLFKTFSVGLSAGQ